MANSTNEYWYTTIFSDSPQQDSKSQTVTLVIILILLFIMILLKVCKRIQRARKSELISSEMLDEGRQFLMSFVQEMLSQRYGIHLPDEVATEQPVRLHET